MKNLFLIAFLFSSILSFAQRQHLQEGDEYFRRRMYKEAIASYQAALQENVVVKKFYMTQQIAKTYKHLFDYKNAAEWYAKLVEFKEDNTAENLYDYAQILMNLERYSDALGIFKAYLEKSGNPEMLSKYEMLCKWPKDNASLSQKFSIYKTNIETGGRSMGVSWYKNGLIYSLPQEQNFEVKTTYYDLAFASSADSIQFGTPVLLAGSTNRSFYEGTPSVSADGNILFFTSNASETEKYKIRQAGKSGISKEGLNVLQIFVAENKNNKWESPKLLFFNSSDYSCAFPFVTNGGKTLYFASDMPGGFGGFDLYVSTKNNDNTWSTPKNLGNTVNTGQDEFYPFVNDGKLYFSSRGLPGFGGSDIYVAPLNDGMPGKPENLGKPFNSSKDDFSFIITNTGKDGYFSSNREGESGYDRIYYFKKKYVADTIRGVVIDKITNKPVDRVDVKLFEIADDGTEKQVNQMYTAADGKWEFLVDPEKKYKVRYELPDYKTEERTVSSINVVGELERNQEKSKLSPVYMNPIVKKNNVVRIDNIYFEFNKAALQPGSYPIMNNVANFLIENPEARIELSAHTDAIGNDSYNLNLSKKRAQACYDYLIEKGIDKSRMVPVGYGETKLLNNCKRKDDCSEEQHAINRRVEVKFL